MIGQNANALNDEIHRLAAAAEGPKQPGVGKETLRTASVRSGVERRPRGKIGRSSPKRALGPVGGRDAQCPAVFVAWST